MASRNPAAYRAVQSLPASDSGRRDRRSARKALVRVGSPVISRSPAPRVRYFQVHSVNTASRWRKSISDQMCTKAQMNHAGMPLTRAQCRSPTARLKPITAMLPRSRYRNGGGTRPRLEMAATLHAICAAPPPTRFRSLPSVLQAPSALGFPRRSAHRRRRHRRRRRRRRCHLRSRTAAVAPLPTTPMASSGCAWRRERTMRSA